MLLTLEEKLVYTDEVKSLQFFRGAKLKKRAHVINLGCPKNQVDSEVITGMLADRFQVTTDPAGAELIIVNTCGFIGDAKRESVEVLCDMAELKRSGACERLYAAGCLAQRYGQELLDEIPELDGVLGDGDLNNIIPSITEPGQLRVHTHKTQQDFLYSEDMPRIRSGPDFFAYVKIAEGCDNCCSYCAIPSIKGRYRSRTIESIVKETEKLALEGVKEISLIAQDTTRYGIDLYGTSRLPDLLRKLVRIEGIEWIRLMYCYPEAFTDELIEIISQEPKICNYVDLPLQHGDNEILAEMNRRNTAEEAEALIAKLRERIPGIFIRSTFIAGFPGETEEQFAKLLNFIRKVKLDRLGAFAYSQEENTPAGRRADQLPEEVREDRKNAVMQLQAELVYETQQRRVGQILSVILEEELSPGEWSGRTEGDAPEIDGQVYVQSDQEHCPGEIVNVRILRADSYDMEGEELK